MLIKKIVRVVLIGVLLTNASVSSAAEVNPSLQIDINNLIGNITNKNELIKIAEKASNKIKIGDDQDAAMKADVDLAIAHLRNEVVRMNGQLNGLNDLADQQRDGTKSNTDMQTYLDTQQVIQSNPLPSRDPQLTNSLQTTISAASYQSNSKKNKRDYQLASAFLIADPQSQPPKPVANSQYDSVNNLSDNNNNNYQSSTELQAMQARRNQQLQQQAAQNRGNYESTDQALDPFVSNNNLDNNNSDNNNAGQSQYGRVTPTENAAMRPLPVASDNNNANPFQQQAQQSSQPISGQNQFQQQAQQSSQPITGQNQFQFPQQQNTNNSQYQQTSAVQRPQRERQTGKLPRAPRVFQLPSNPAAAAQLNNNNNNGLIQQAANRPLPPSNRPLPAGPAPTGANQSQFTALGNQPRQRDASTAASNGAPFQNTGQPRRRLPTSNAAVQSTSSQAQQANTAQNTGQNYHPVPAGTQATNNGLNTNQTLQQNAQANNSQNTAQNRQGVGGQRLNNNNNNRNNRNKNGKKRSK